MHDEQGNSVEETKSKQYRMLAIVIGIALAVLSGFFYLLNSSPVVKNEEKLESAPFSSPVSAVDSKSALIDLIQKEMKTQKNQTEELKQALEAIKEESKGSQENMEMQSSDRHAGTSPVVLMIPRVGLRPTMLLNAAGTRPEPAVSVPREKSTRFAATATADPLLDPPETYAGSNTLRQAP